MYHASWEMPSFEALEQFHERLLASATRITGYSDRACNVMFLDPDGNELEAFWDPPTEIREQAHAGQVALPRLAR
jgi:catechol-2,3-dioxygenase